MRVLIKGFISLAVFIVAINIFAEQEKNRTQESRNKNTYKTDAINFGFYGQADSVWYDGDTHDNVNDKVNFKDSVNIPRARFYVRGDIGDLYYIFTYDAAEENLRENYLRYKGIENAYFQVGQYKPAVSMWYSTSHRFYIFMERGLPVAAFVPGYRVGAQLLVFKDPITFTAGMFGPDIANRFYGNQVEGHTPLAYNTRFTFVPINLQRHVLHFGVAGVYQETDSTESFQFRTIPEVQMYRNQFLIDAGQIKKCKHFFEDEFEIAYIYKAFSVEGEYFSVLVNRQKQKNVGFNGYYLTVDYFLTGESYKYNFKEGIIEGITPIRHCFGAIQIALRYSETDLDDQNIQGGREYNKTCGINWYVNENVRFVLNYIRVHTSPSENGQNRDMNIIGIRCQLSA